MYGLRVALCFASVTVLCAVGCGGGGSAANSHVPEATESVLVVAPSLSPVLQQDGEHISQLAVQTNIDGKHVAWYGTLGDGAVNRIASVAYWSAGDQSGEPVVTTISFDPLGHASMFANSDSPARLIIVDPDAYGISHDDIPGVCAVVIDDVYSSNPHYHLMVMIPNESGGDPDIVEYDSVVNSEVTQQFLTAHPQVSALVDRIFGNERQWLPRNASLAAAQFNELWNTGGAVVSREAPTLPLGSFESAAGQLQLMLPAIRRGFLVGVSGLVATFLFPPALPFIINSWIGFEITSHAFTQMLDYNANPWDGKGWNRAFGLSHCYPGSITCKAD